MLSPRVAVGIADRLAESRDPEALRRKGLLDSCIVVVFVLHMMGILAFIRLQEWEAACVRVIRDVGVQFELTPPPVNEIVAVPMVPPPILVEGVPVRRKTPAQKPTVPESATPGANFVSPALSRLAARIENRQAQRVARSTPAAPIAVTPTNIIKALPMTASATERIAAVATAPMSAGGLTESGEGSSDGAAKSDGTAGGQRGTEMAITTILPPGDGGQLNIAPYRKELLRRIARNWNPAGAVGDLTVLLRIARDGTLLDVELIQSSGKKKLDRQVLEAIRSTEFAPLPDAYKSSELRFKIDFSSVGIGWQ